MSNVGRGYRYGQVLVWDYADSTYKWMPTANPTIGQVLSWDGSKLVWTTPTVGGTASGDLSGTYPSPTVGGIQGRAVSSATPSTGYFLRYSGTQWEPQPPFTGLSTGAVITNSATDTPVGVSGTVSGQVLTWNGSAWAAAAAAGGLTGYTHSASPFGTALGFGTAATGVTHYGRTLVGAYAGASLGAAGSGYTTLVGFEAGLYLTTAVSSTAVGALALHQATGGGNTAVGRSAGYSISTGAENCCFGAYSMGSSTDNIGTVCVGAYSGNGGGGSGSVHIGYYAGYLVTAVGEVYIGYQAGRNITVATSIGNVGIGYEAMKGASGTSIACAQNTVVGYQAGSGAAYNAGGNTLFGYQAGLVLSTGTGNVMMGQGAGAAVTTGGSNVLIGKFVGAALISAGSNTILGSNACPTLQTGSANVMIGYDTCDGMTDGDVNVAICQFSGPTSNRSHTISIGQYAGSAVGDYSISIGERAAQNYGSGVDGIAIGQYAADGAGNVTGANNISIGKESHGGITTTSNNNTAIGYRARLTAQLGSGNVAIGYRAGYGESTADVSGSVLLGYDAGYRNQGNYAISIGYQSMGNTTGDATGVDNICIGYQTGYVLTTGGGNCLVGKSAGVALTTGADNVCLGRLAGDSISTGGSNICIGVSADLAGGGESNEIVIGNGAVGKGSNTTVLGRSSATATTDTWLRGTTGHLGNETSGENISFLFETTDNATRPGFQYQTGTGLVYYQNAGGSWASLDSLSDARLKKNIEDLPYGLEFVRSLRPVLFDWKEPSGTVQARKQMGVVAQELKKSCEDAGLDPGLVDDSGKYMTVHYEQLVPSLIKAVQELSVQVVELKKELAELKAQR